MSALPCTEPVATAEPAAGIAMPWGPLLACLQAALPPLSAAYVFGSQAQGTAGPGSDLDLAVLAGGPVDPLQLWRLAADLAGLAGCPVDLVDLRAANTVMQYQVLTTGRRLWADEPAASLFECRVLSEKTALDEARAGLLADILADGTVGRLAPAAAVGRGGRMVDDMLLNKAAVIERCVARAREEYAAAGAGFATDFSHQDAAILNIQRACEAALDMGQHLIRRDRLGVPQGARDVFDLLARGGRIPAGLALALQHMVGYRNIAVHEYQKLLLLITVSVITHHLDEFLQFSQALLLRES